MAVELEECLGFVRRFDFTKIVPETESFLSQAVIKIFGEKMFQFVFNCKESLLLLTTGLNKTGVKVVDPHIFDRHPDSVHNSPMECESHDQNVAGAFHLYKTEIPYRDFDFHILINSSNTAAFQIQPADYLWSKQLCLSVMTNQDSADLELTNGETSFKVHKFIMAAHSPIFAAHLLDNETQQLEIPFATAACTQQFLHFIYTGELQGPVRCKRLLELAEMYKIQSLIDLCRGALPDVLQDELARNLFLHRTSKAPSIRNKLEPDQEIDLFSNTLVLKYTWKTEWTEKMLVGDYTGMSTSFTHRGESGEPFFRAHIQMNKSEYRDYDWYLEVSLLSYYPQRIGCKVSRVLYCIDWDAETPSTPPELIFPMDERPAKGEALLQTFKGSINYDATKYIIFYVHLESVVPNFGHKILDSTWKEHLWASSVKKQFTDFEFLVGDESFAAHRSLLSARSPVFAAMFRSGMQESQTGKVRLDEDVKPSTFRLFLKFLYTGTLESLTDREALLPLADKYQVETFANLCQPATRFDIEAFVGDVLSC